MGFGGAELVLHPKGEYIYIRDLNLVLTAKLLICAELAGDFHLGYARQLTDKSSLLFDLAF